MAITLKIIPLNGQTDHPEQTVIIDQLGSIGRSESNTLTLVDENKMISRQHAQIEFREGVYTLTDSSLAGTFIDEANEPMNNNSVQLSDGMKIRIGEYSIICQITHAAEVSKDEPPAILVNETVRPETLFNNMEDIRNPFAEDFTEKNSTINNIESPFVVEAKQDTEPSGCLHQVEDEFVMGLNHEPEKNALLDGVASGSDALPYELDNALLDPIQEAEGSDGILSANISSLNDSFVVTEPVKSILSFELGGMPEDFNFEDLFNDDSPLVEKVVPEKVEQTEQADTKFSLAKPQASYQQLLQAFLTGVGVESSRIDFDNPEQKMVLIGGMFRRFVDNTVAVLRSRAEFKSLFRVSVTTIKGADNNPLKFAVSTDEAIKHLINDGQGGFKESVASIDEGFNDLLNHQLAMQAGIQASLADILRQFDPALIENKYKEGFVVQKKAKCWNNYLEVYQHLSESAIDDFFGDAFSDAYEKQMKQLKQ